MTILFLLANFQFLSNARPNRAISRSLSMSYARILLKFKNNIYLVKGRLLLGKYRLLKAWLIVLILLPIVPPSCMLLASASSRADCVTEASTMN